MPLSEGSSTIAQQRGPNNVLEDHRLAKMMIFMVLGQHEVKIVILGTLISFVSKKMAAKSDLLKFIITWQSEPSNYERRL